MPNPGYPFLAADMAAALADTAGPGQTALFPGSDDTFRLVFQSPEAAMEYEGSRGMVPTEPTAITMADDVVRLAMAVGDIFNVVGKPYRIRSIGPEEYGVTLLRLQEV